MNNAIDTLLAVSGLLGDNGRSGGGMSPAVKSALLQLMEHVAYTDEHGQEYYDALVAALNGGSVPVLESISAVFSQGSAVIYDTDSLDSLRQYLTVTATYDDGTTTAVTNYSMSGTLTVGTSIITASYGGKTDTFSVAVSERSVFPPEYQKVEWVGVENTSTQPTAYISAGADAIKNGDTLHVELKPFSILGQYDSPLGWEPTPTWEFYYNASGSDLELWTQGVSASMVSKNIGDWDNADLSFGGDTGLTILRYKTDRYAFSGKIKTLYIKNSNGDFTHNYVPCYRKSDGEIGVYDTITGTFYTNSGTGTLVKGGNV